MSKYIDELTELICDAVRTVFPNASLDDGYDVADDVIAKLPTIEVRDCSDYYKGYCSRYEDGCFHQCKDAPSVVPKARPIEMHLDVTDDVVDRAVEQIRVEGEWIRQGISPHEGIQICSVCGAMYDITAEFDNCPNCHAKMKGERR